MPRSSPLQPSPLAPRPDEPGWPHEIYRALKAADIRQVSYVPDAGHRSLIELAHADPAIETTVLTTEEEGIALAAGAWLGGQRAVLLMQSSGVGNCINMLSLIATCRFPLLTLVTMRGEWGEFNPWQVPMGQAVRPVLEAVGVKCFPVDKAEEVGEVFVAAADLAFLFLRRSAAVAHFSPSRILFSPFREHGDMLDLTISVRRVAVVAAALAATVGVLAAAAQVKTNVPDPVTGARPASVERIKIHGTALEGNLEGDTVDRDVIVFLPPSYSQNRTSRYPVVYALHGYSIGAEQWTQEIHVPQTI